MKQRSFLSIIWFVLKSFVVTSVSAQTCIENNKKFVPNGTYDQNRHRILSSLPSHVAAGNGFYNDSIGQEPNRVYAIGMCIPRVDAQDCSACIKSASDWLRLSCPNQTDAYYWTLDPTLCLVRYSNNVFSGSAAYWDTVLQYLVFNTANITSNLTDFEMIWEKLTLRTIAAASTAKSTASSSDNHYKADATHLTEFQKMYALMQCTPDISPGDCENCLLQGVKDYQSCCGQRTGGYVMRPICFFRWQFFTFSKAFANITVAPPPSPLLQPPVIDVPLPPSATPDSGRGKNSTRAIVEIVVPLVVVIFIIIILILLAKRSALFCWKRKPNQEIDLDQSGITSVHSLQLDFKTIEVATDKFTSSNKLGEGGFGEVYKGTLPNGVDVAVKRLSKTSTQGVLEFKNEVVVVAKLQHRNLVRLLGFCLEAEEKILVYEFVPNKSLDYFLFDPTKQGQLDWTKRYNIIGGITRGILYLHQDSRLTIIHRDLKASNILLDSDMSAKIADFGMARIFGMNQNGANTNRIVGKRGYMSSEYVMQGLFSTKSDVYSFGVLVLEIICGRKNRFVHQSDTIVENLVTYAWRLWRSGSPLELVDPTISGNCRFEEVTRCIHIALICVQDEPTDRPNLSAINMMLTSNAIVLPVPQQPRFLPSRRNQEQDVIESSQSTTIRSNTQTINDVTITDLEPR